MKVLVTGISGVLGRLVAQRLVAGGHTVVGLDRRPWPTAPDNITVHRLDVRKRAAEEVFRTFRPDGVVHMATVTFIDRGNEDRYRINVGGTRAVFESCDKYGVGRMVFVGRHTYYGAGPASPLYHHEDEPPTMTGAFPELADLVAADLYAGNALWRFPELSTAVLRMCYTLGPGRHGTLASFLKSPRVPMVLGFDPLFQILHERDAADAIALSLETGIKGVFNVAGPDPLPLSVVVREAGRRPVPVPESMMRAVARLLRLPGLSKGALEHVKYPIVIDADAFREATGFQHRYDAGATLAAFRAVS